MKDLLGGVSGLTVAITAHEDNTIESDIFISRLIISLFPNERSARGSE